MAQRVVKVLTDDLTGEELEAGKGQTVQLSYAGVEYELDLSDKSVAKLDKALEPFLSAARRVGGRKQRGRATGGSKRRSDLAEVRAWAREQGYDVSDRGRVPGEILEAYDAS